MSAIGIFFGGRSNEREISIITGMYAVNLLRRSDCKIVPVYLPEEGGMAIVKAEGVNDFADLIGKKTTPVYLAGNTLYHAKKHKAVEKIDCALNCCHGGMGEDGTLSALLRWNGVPFASPDTAVSAVFMNKEYSKIAARGLNIPVLDSFAVCEEEWRRDRGQVLTRAKEFGYPAVVKPSRLGSSIGVKVANDAEELEMALDLAFRLDSGAIVERYLEGKRDVNCAAYRRGGEIVVSPCEEVFSDGEILTFSEKYESATKRESVLPANLPAPVAEEIAHFTRLIYESFHVRGVVRADFLVSGDRVYFNELNTVPGSLACYLFSDSLTAARDFLLALTKEAKAEEKKEVITTGILNDRVFTGAKACKRREKRV